MVPPIFKIMYPNILESVKKGLSINFLIDDFYIEINIFRLKSLCYFKFKKIKKLKKKENKGRKEEYKF